jgi:N-dimethylarginine dimethylaminohydrolase
MIMGCALPLGGYEMTDARGATSIYLHPDTAFSALSSKQTLRYLDTVNKSKVIRKIHSLSAE